ncbi:MAG: hypothetical protein IT454_12825 [Planctomycetes bacterium]|nr:hypothetical protein [Planctomycetota bacterium]
MLSLVLLALANELPPLSVHVLAGRVEVAHAGGIREIGVSSGETLFDGPGYLEAGALARVDMRWTAVGSLGFNGRAAFEWRPAHDDPGVLFFDLVRVDDAHFEVRRGPIRVAVPGGWLLHVERGALFLRLMPDGRYELELAAGAPLLVSLESAPGAVRPPWTVLPGARLRLDARELSENKRSVRLDARPEARAIERDPRHAPWTAFSWPWEDDAWAPLMIEVDPDDEQWRAAHDEQRLERMMEELTEDPRDADSAGLSPTPPNPGVAPLEQRVAPRAPQVGSAERAVRLTPWGARWTKRR